MRSSIRPSLSHVPCIDVVDGVSVVVVVAAAAAALLLLL